MPDQYLSRYASPEATLAESIDEHYANVVVVPAYDESAALLDGILPATASADRTLCILVVNARADAPAAARAANAALLARVRDAATNVRAQQANSWLCRSTDTLDVLLIDRSSEGNSLPAKQGVGMARRIGCDVALNLGHHGRIASRWIHTTDADVTLPADYFTAAADVEARTDLVALTYPFWHESDDSDKGRALALYELSLRYYVLGLRWAGSAYAFHTVGSTLAVDALAYAKARGVPLRQAGEDFYLLSKLAKLGKIHTPDAEPIRIQQRTSTRVPFGTGPATQTISDALRRGEDMNVYHPATFRLLRGTLEAAEHAVHRGEACSFDKASAGLEPSLATAMRAGWSRIQLEKGVADVGRGATTPGARVRRFGQWFDGFRTLAFVHGTRDAGLTNIAWQEAFDQAPFVPTTIGPAAGPAGFRQRLYLLEHERE